MLNQGTIGQGLNGHIKYAIHMYCHGCVDVVSGPTNWITKYVTVYSRGLLWKARRTQNCDACFRLHVFLCV